jgi:hypothetical protein
MGTESNLGEGASLSVLPFLEVVSYFCRDALVILKGLFG